MHFVAFVGSALRTRMRVDHGPHSGPYVNVAALYNDFRRPAFGRCKRINFRCLQELKLENWRNLANSLAGFACRWQTGYLK